MTYLRKEDIEEELRELDYLHKEAKYAVEKYQDKRKELTEKGYKFETKISYISWLIDGEYHEYVSFNF